MDFDNRRHQVGRDLVILARQAYDKYSKSGLLEAAEREGVATLHVALLPKQGCIEITRLGQPVSRLPYRCSARRIAAGIREAFAEFSRDAGSATGPAASRDMVVLHACAYASCLKVLGIKYWLRPHVFLFYVTDWFFYEASGAKLALFKWIDALYKRISDGVVLLMADLRDHYPGAFHLDNASHLAQQPRVAQGDLKVAVISSFDQRTDFDLLQQLAERLPNFSFHLYGWIHVNDLRVASRMREIQRLPNVHYHGEYRNATLGEVLAGYRVGLMPYVTPHKLTRYINPDKIYHYLCAGLEVVSTSLPQSMKVQQYIHLADDAEAMAVQIEALVAGKGHKNPGNLDQQFNWDRRWQTLKRIIGEARSA